MKPDEVVGVRLERSDLSAIALLAIWRAGGVYIPIDLSYPLEHVGHITEDNGLHLVVCETEQARSLGAMGLTPIDPSATGSERELRPPQDLEQPAVVMYTSGSTGRPKGITHSHASLLNRFGWLLQRYPIEDDEVLLQRTNINFIPSLWEIVAGIFAGCETLIVPDETTRDPVGLCELAYHYGATRMGLVPALLTAILESVPDVERKLAGLRLINIAGQQLSRVVIL